MLRQLLTWLEDRILMRILSRRDAGNGIALVDPRCGCLRSPDVPLSKPCPDTDHARSTRRAFSALNDLERQGH